MWQDLIPNFDRFATGARFQMQHVSGLPNSVRPLALSWLSLKFVLLFWSLCCCLGLTCCLVVAGWREFESKVICSEGNSIPPSNPSISLGAVVIMGMFPSLLSTCRFLLGLSLIKFLFPHPLIHFYLGIMQLALESSPFCPTADPLQRPFQSFRMLFPGEP
jgi:hypothetical protein